jgi:hypothetical protein|tara:strand:+ start:16144 stop:16689 length:546 start_codon:yes stop_codon:yes gene_type:complete
MFAKVSEGLYIGDASVTKDKSLMHTHGITAVIRLDNIDDSPFYNDGELVTYVIPSYELIDVEIPKIASRVKRIAAHISDLKSEGYNVLIQCIDGKNKCAMIAAYFLSTYYNVLPINAVYTLKTIYFTDLQRGEEKIYDERVAKIQRGTQVIDMTPDDNEKTTIRNTLRALTNTSYIKIVCM